MSTFTTWNPSDKHAHVTLTNGDLTAEKGVDSNVRSVRAAHYQAAGKFYFEVSVDALAGGSPSAYIGLSNDDQDLASATVFAASSDGYAYRHTGQKYNGSSTSYGTSYAAGDIIGVAVDFTAGAVWFSKNGTWQNSATIGEVEAGTTTNAAFTGIAEPLTPAVAMNTQIILTLRSDPDDLDYTVPTGFTAGWSAPTTGQGTVTLPLTISGSAKVSPLHAEGAVSLPLTVSGSARIQPIHASGTITIPLGLTGSAAVRIVRGAIDATLSELTASLSGTVGFMGAIDGTLGALTGDLAGTLAFVGSIDATLSELTASGAGYVPFEGAIDGILGALTFSGVGYFDVDGDYHVAVINLRTGAVTEYADFVFNSITVWNGSLYGANEDGIYLLGGEEAIDAYLRSGITDHDENLSKRATDVYVSAESVSPMVFSVRLDEGDDVYPYSVPTDRHATFDGHKAPLGRGIRARYLQYELANTDGAYFEADQFEVIVNPIENRRKR